MVREIYNNELNDLLTLYLDLHETSIPNMNDNLIKTWDDIINDENYHIIVNVVDGIIVSSVTCVIIPNLTRNARPYAFVENVVTKKEYRNKGYASECLEYASAISKNKNCYKMMLLTGAKDKETLSFYEKSGYNSNDKTAFIKWL